jgi:hypothetical protein
MRDSELVDRLYDIYIQNCQIQETLGELLLHIDNTQRQLYKICDPIKPYKGDIKSLTLK